MHLQVSLAACLQNLLIRFKPHQACSIGSTSIQTFPDNWYLPNLAAVADTLDCQSIAGNLKPARETCTVLLAEKLTWMTAGKVENSIRMGGLAEIKTERIKAILSTLKEEQGKISLEYIRDMEDEDVKNELTRCVHDPSCAVKAVARLLLSLHEIHLCLGVLC